MNMDDVLARVCERRAKGSQMPSLDDIERAVKKLKVGLDGSEELKWVSMACNVLNKNDMFSPMNISVIAYSTAGIG